MELISDYIRDDGYRHLLNDLTRSTFGFDFENWVTQGYFEGEYIPYSLIEDGRIVSNVSANRMRFIQNGAEKYYIQIGTVMTDARYRKRGLAAQLMRRVLETYEAECGGIYLFGNLSAVGFYQKMGFQIRNQYRYFVKEEFCRGEKAGTRFLPVKGMGEGIRRRYLELVRNGAAQSSFEQLNKYGLQLFYTAGLDQVYYAEDLDCFIVLDQDECTALNQDESAVPDQSIDGAAGQKSCTVIQSVVCGEKIPLTEILRRVELTNDSCRLGFTPHEEDRELCVSEVYDGGEDYRLFCRGSALEAIERDRLYFPELSHA